MAFTAPIFVKIVITERHNMAIYTEFHPNQLRNVEITSKSIYGRTKSKALTAPIS
jgi:hypothetical protein